LRRLNRIKSSDKTKLHVVGWTEDVARLMQAASLLVTKPGGLTLAEAALCGLPVIMFNGIPGPETVNSERFASMGAGVITHDVSETVSAIENLLRDERMRAAMSSRSRQLARPDAASDVARLALRESDEDVLKSQAVDDCLSKSVEQKVEGRGPLLILSISNGAAHTRAAEVIASAIRAAQPTTEVLVVDVADYMTRIARFTHVTAYLWLVKYAPGLWDRVDRYQKKQTHTSPEWYYRRGVRRLFELARKIEPSVLIATEVGCCEIAALIKRDLLMDGTPLVAVNLDHDAERAWVRSEVNLYCASTERVRDELVAHGALPERIRVWGVPVEPEFRLHSRREEERAEVCRWLRLAPQLPLILVAGGSCGLGRIEEIVGRLLKLQRPRLQVVALTGRNEHLRRRLNRLTPDHFGQRLRVLGWTGDVARLMHAADLLVSKFGNTFVEAIAAELPLIGLEPPPGSERVQYRLLEEWGTGRAVRDIDELAEVVAELLNNRERLNAMRRRAREHNQRDAGALIAEWVLRHNEKENFVSEQLPSMIGSQSVMSEELIESRL
ncbi:MAG TPA: glycosyltransferase, partial [Pyrinomonadaceae bacterium]|nr:glycosyltransferase [Pyrinomonadaceae bacterium]